MTDQTTRAPSAHGSSRQCTVAKRAAQSRKSISDTPRAVRENFVQLLGGLPQATWDIKNTVYEGDAMLLEWGAEGDGNRVGDGVDTFIFGDGLIRL
jgi:hypothetical protein